MPKAYTPNDKYFYKAKELGYRARSAFKFEEIQEKFHIIEKRNYVLDLGAAPGSFMQVASKIVGNNGKVIGIDLQPIAPFKEENIISFVGDVFDQETLRKKLSQIGIHQVDSIISDLAPKTSGIKDVDQWKSVELNLEVLKVAEIFLKEGGNILMKVFVGEDFPEIIRATKNMFKITKNYKPKACRDRSMETYIIGIGKKKLESKA